MARVILRDGRIADFHEAGRHADDKMKLRELFAAGSDESRYLRFFRVVHEVSEKDIERMLQSDGVEQFTLICVSENRAIGVGTYTKIEAGVAEVAFFVADKDQGRGIGTLLLEHLATVAWEFGYRRFEAGVLHENRRMQRVFLSSGYEIVTQSHGDTVKMVLPLHQSERTKSLQDLREKHAAAGSLRPFLEPRSIAVIGASRRIGSLGRMVFQHIVDSDFAGTVYPVNLTASSVSAVKAYQRIGDIPERIDLAVIVVPAELVGTVASECLAAGVTAMLVVSSGFAELGADGVERQARLTDMLRLAGCRLIGPNSLGLVNTSPSFRLNGSLARDMPKMGGLGIASQSGALGIAILAYATRCGVGVSSFVSTGNRADVSSNDLLQYWEDDVHTRMIALYMESFGNPRKFSRIARRLSRRKPIVAVKSARTSASYQVSDMNRTTMYADDTVVDGLFQQTGIIRVDTLLELFDVCALLNSMPLPSGGRVAVVTNSAGGAVMAVDALVKFGLHFVGPVLDLGSDALAMGYAAVLPALLRDNQVDAILVVFIPVGPSVDEDILSVVAEAVGQARGVGIDKPVLANCLVTEDSAVHLAQRGDLQIPVYPFPEQAARALAHTARYASYVRQKVGRIPDLDGFDIEVVHSLVGDAPLPTEPSDDTLASILSAVGIPIGQGEPAAMGRLIVEAEFHPLFGPVVRLWEPDRNQGGNPHPRRAVERLAPLTDLDAEIMVGTVPLSYPNKPSMAPMRDILLRVSRLVDEQHRILRLRLSLNVESEVPSVVLAHSDVQFTFGEGVIVPYR